jgi:hypothetical protein
MAERRVTIQGTDLLLGGDIILSVNDIDVTAPTMTESFALGAGDSYDRIANTICSLKAGDALVLKVLREGKIVKLTTTTEP